MPNAGMPNEGTRYKVRGGLQIRVYRADAQLQVTNYKLQVIGKNLGFHFYFKYIAKRYRNL